LLFNQKCSQIVEKDAKISELEEFVAFYSPFCVQAKIIKLVGLKNGCWHAKWWHAKW
jgi:hypothetical protein